MSMPPRWSRPASRSALTPASVAASPGTGWPPISCATAVAASASRSLTTTRAPSVAIRVAMARPIPCPAQVRTTPLPFTSTSHTSRECDAAVDDDDLPGDPGGVLGEQEGHDTADVLRYAEPLERVCRGDLVLTPFVKGGGEPRLHHGGCHRVDADAGAEFDRELLRDVGEHGLARSVEADAGRGLQTGHRRHVDNRAAVLTHPGTMGLLNPGQGGQGVDLDDLARSVEVEVDQRAVDRVDAGVVHQQVDAAERLDGRLDGIALMLDIVGLACDRDRVLRTTQRRHSLVQRLLLAGGDADPRAVCDQPFGDAEADTPARSGHHGDLALEPVTHQESLSRIMACLLYTSPSPRD